TAAHAVAVDLRKNRHNPQDHLHLAHLHREERTGLPLYDRRVFDDVQREARLAKTGTARDEDEIGGLESTGLLVDRLDARANPEAHVTARVDLFGVAAERDVQRDDIPMERRFAHREEQLLRVRYRGGRFLAGQRETGDPVGDADQAAKERGALDDRRVARRVRDRGPVVHEAAQELRAPDRIELTVRDEVRLHVGEPDLLAALGDAGDGGEHDPMLLARQVRGPEASARDLVVEGAVHEHRAEE